MEMCKSKITIKKPVCVFQLGRSWIQKNETTVLMIFAVLSIVSFYYPIN